MNINDSVNTCARQGWRCILCDKPLLNARRQLKEPIDVEHVVPQWMGGKALSVAHKRCNRAKGFTLPTEEQMLRYIKAHAPTEVRRYYEKRGII